ncbi:MAG: LysM peptidoglycan-binding domain-containing protein [Candidatus Omnitrophica bacterium]|nr:LysM peptidoglycan-binding domain-containing protein [Candidatus Omnitrophota bacterium]
MGRGKLLLTLGLLLFLILSGCTVRSYKQTRDRIDQDLDSGNRGYLEGEVSGEEVERKSTRTTQVVEVELGGKSIKLEKAAQDVEVKEEAEAVEEAFKDEDVDTGLWGNQGYKPESVSSEEVKAEESAEVYFQDYTVGENDTLQKISQRFYGTTRQWMKIYEANQGVLSSPDKLSLGQVIKIPLKRSTGAGESFK